VVFGRTSAAITSTAPKHFGIPRRQSAEPMQEDHQESSGEDIASYLGFGDGTLDEEDQLAQQASVYQCEIGPVLYLPLLQIRIACVKAKS